ncbi:MAG TPA: CaiB/BaiF CoA-transferase family protein [Trebonia sp.]|nr:CaiB/BaiF CoA-transferase family protein [Trebonia sp.]
MSEGPLSGVRVVEMACIGPGPFAGMLLADLGADIVRVDRPDNVGGRRSDAESHLVLDRGRRSVAVDLKHPRGPEVVLHLAERADVLIEGFRPGVMERLGLGPDIASERNPRLVYGRMTGWGQDGPEAQRAGHDINYISLAGALEPIAAPGGGAPVAPLNMLGDFGGGGMLLALGVVSALLHARETGRGQVVDASILDGTALLTAMTHAIRASGGWNAPRGENLFDGGAPYYGVFECADGRWLSVGAIESKFYAALVAGLGLAAELPPGDQHDRSRWPRQRELIATAIAGRTRDEWVAAFAGLDACVAPVLAPGEVLSHPHLAARQVFASDGGLTHPEPAPRFSVTPGARQGAAPLVGEHTEAVLAEAGLDAAELRESGAVFQG